MNTIFSAFISIARAATDEITGLPTLAIPKIQFVSSVGLNSGICGLEPDGTYLGCYISVIYTFFVQAAIVLAVVMVMVGGFQWLLATGNSSKISEAKSTISAAIFGLILALTSYLLFAQINTQLVDLQSLDIIPVKITNSISAPPGYCLRTSEKPRLNKIRVSETTLWNSEQQLQTFHPSVIKVLNNLEERMKNTSPWNVVPVWLKNVTDGLIWPHVHLSQGQQRCRRDDPRGDLVGTCTRTDDSYHYGGPANKCAFDGQYPPVSCAVDLQLNSATAIYYSFLADEMRDAGFDYVECKNSSNEDISCSSILELINHVHGELFAYPDLDSPDKPYCNTVMQQEAGNL